MLAMVAMLTSSAYAHATDAPLRLEVASTSSSSAVLRWRHASVHRDEKRERKLFVQRQYEIPSHRGQWFTVAELPYTATNFTVPGLLERQQYSFCVCASTTASTLSQLPQLSQLCSATTTSRTSAPSKAARGFIIADSNTAYPRNGEGTVVRDGKSLLYFYTRFTVNHDVGASDIVYKVSMTDGESWSEPLVIAPSGDKGRANPGASVSSSKPSNWD
eukprot:SAG31_NODE_1387_length_8554_cov_14.239148_6_plen_217_part_00